ncbi:DUF2325 domain-containing protein [Zoogloea sp. LCSB751]|uniref:DUF2325 domain-containing protein n=1 Tax=Zoogloea sp. LCSB751 TaxID=1965277 RepID=UPI0013747CEB|nr:DUF2325 domain-containing protein [Zoogloea sp. LCSB751]
MCLAPESQPQSLQSLLRAEYANALVAIEPPTGSTAGRKRPKLWDLDDKHHCPLIGTCLSIDELQRFAKRFHFTARPGDEFALHVEAVAQCRTRSPASEAMQRHLDRKYLLWVDRFGKLKDDKALQTLWHECQQRGEIAGPLWALCTHRNASQTSLQQAYADVHMLSHQVGAGLAADTRRLAHLEKENAELKGGLKRELAALRRQLAAAEAERAERDTLRNDIDTLQKRLQCFESGQVVVEMGQRLMALQTSHDKLLATSGRVWELERNLKDIREDAQRIAVERDAALAERDALEHLLRAMEPATCEITADGDACAACEHALGARCVLYVGGRAALLAQYRQLAERLGITLIHHDGGQEESLSRLPELIRSADAVMCPTDHISHNAYYHVKAHCKRVGKPCLFYRGGGISGFAVAMARIGRGEYSLAGEMG